jgi:hypothetical protein
MRTERRRIVSPRSPALPFGYYAEHAAGLLLLRRADGSLVAVFRARDVDLFEVELAVWEDAD